MNTCEERINEHLESRGEDFLGFMNGMSSDDDDTREETIEEYSNYGLCLDFVEPFTFDDQEEGYLRYQLSWGGPGDELRFYDDRVEYWFLDWFDGASRDVSHLGWVKWLREDFADFVYYIKRPDSELAELISTLNRKEDNNALRNDRR